MQQSHSAGRQLVLSIVPIFVLILIGSLVVGAIFAGGMLAGRPVIVNSDGLQQRDFIYVGDIARANLAALTGDPVRLTHAAEGLMAILEPHQPFRALTIQIPREEGFGS